MAPSERIDETDARILDLLQRDGREPYAEVGQAVGMSGPSVHERVKKLESRGIIRGYAAIVDPPSVGLGVLAFIFIRQVPGTVATNLTGMFGGISDIEECHHIAGESDYLLKVRATDTRHLEEVLHAIQQVPHVSTTETMVVFSSAFERRPLHLPREAWAHAAREGGRESADPAMPGDPRAEAARAHSPEQRRSTLNGHAPAETDPAAVS